MLKCPEWLKDDFITCFKQEYDKRMDNRCFLSRVNEKKDARLQSMGEHAI